jgi:hypothetical protein
MSDDLERLRRLGTWRARPERLASASGDLSGMAREIRRLEKSIGGATDAWIRIAPPALQAVARVDTLRGGTLTLVVDGSAAAFEVDRALRSGMEASLRMAIPGLMRIRTRVGGPQEG